MPIISCSPRHSRRFIQQISDKVDYKNLFKCINNIIRQLFRTEILGLVEIDEMKEQIDIEKPAINPQRFDHDSLKSAQRRTTKESMKKGMDGMVSSLPG